MKSGSIYKDAAVAETLDQVEVFCKASYIQKLIALVAYSFVCKNEIITANKIATKIYKEISKANSQWKIEKEVISLVNYKIFFRKNRELDDLNTNTHLIINDDLLDFLKRKDIQREVKKFNNILKTKEAFDKYVKEQQYYFSQEMFEAAAEITYKEKQKNREEKIEQKPAATEKETIETFNEKLLVDMVDV